jgi:hypothetical protein
MSVKFVEDQVLLKAIVIVQETFSMSVEYVEEIAHLALVVLTKTHVIMKETLSMMGLVFTVERDVRAVVSQ